jgi:hypothetical protein
VVTWRAVPIDVAVIGACLALVATGVVIVVRWGEGDPGPASPGPTRSAPKRVVRYSAVAFAAGVAAGVLGAGAGGRLVMGLLAVTSQESHGMLTEGGATVGEISLAGTLSFIQFVGVAAGVLSALLYVVAGSLLPGGRVGGVALGLMLLVFAGARFEPLRADNFDFNLVGPDWLSLLSFSALAVFQGMLMWAFARRLNLRPLPLGGQRAVAAGRVAAGVLVLAALPGFVSAVADILAVG